MAEQTGSLPDSGDWTHVQTDGPTAPTATERVGMHAAGSRTNGFESRALVDLKGLAKPTPFDGTDEKWNDWSFRFRSVAALLGCMQMLTWAEKHIGDIDEKALTNEQRQPSLMLWSLLAQ